MATTGGKAVIGITPTFTLRRIDPREIYEKYTKDVYISVSLPKDKIAVHVAPIMVEPTLGNSPSQGIYAFKLKNNTTQVIATSNSVPFEYYMANGEELPCGGECRTCRKQYPTRALGIPVRMTETVNAEGAPCMKYFLDDCSYCSFECAYSGYKLYHCMGSRYSDPLYMDSEQLLRFMFKQAHPHGGILKEAPDPRLSMRFCGPLDDDAFHSKKHTYARMPNVILAPVKVQYQRSN